ncbi:transposase domain-containing protein [Erysipelothrix larvae]|nr:transposase domain-containing protein [Erysipelothrix larvae]
MSSIYYSIVETAKLNNLDIQSYFEYILDEMIIWVSI